MEWSETLTFDTEIVDNVLTDALGLSSDLYTEEEKKDIWQGCEERAWEEFYSKMYDSLRWTIAEENLDKLPKHIKPKYTY